MSAAPQPALGRAMVNVFDRTRNAYADEPKLLISAIDGSQHVLSRDFHDHPSVFLANLPISHNFADSYSILAAADGYKDAGFFPVKMVSNTVQIVNLMLLPKSNQVNLAGATWKILGAKRPDLQALLAAGLNDTSTAEERYNE